MVAKQGVIEQLAVELTLEAQSFSKQMSTINRTIRQADREFKTASKGVKDYEKTYVGLDHKIQTSSKKLDLYNTKLQKQKQEYEKLEGTLNKQKEKLDNLENSLGKNSDEWKKQSQLVQQNSQRLSKLGTDIKSTENNISKLNSELNEAQNEFNNLGNKTKSASEKLAEIDSKAELAKSEFDALGSELEASGNSVAKLKNDMNKLSSELDSNKQKMNIYEDEIKQLSTKLTESTQEHSRLGREITRTEISLEKAKNEFGENSNKAIELKQKLLTLKDSYNTLDNEINDNERELNQYKVKLNETKREVNNLSKELKTMPFDQVSNKLKDAGGAVKDVGRSLTTGVTAPTVAAGVAAGKMAYDYDQGLAKVGSLVNKSGKEMREYDDTIKAMSKSTGVSLDNLTESMYQGISAGGDLGNIFKLTEVAAKTAIGGFTETDVAIDGLTSTMNAFGIEYKNVDKVANKFILTQNKGKTTVDELASSIGKVAPTANAAGVGVDELLASVASLTMNGIATSEAMTALKAALSNVIKPSTEAQKLAKKLGIEFNVAGLQSKGFAGFLEEIKKKTNGNVETMGKLFGSTEALNAMLLLTGEGAETFNEVLKEMGGELDLVDKAFGNMKESAGAQLQDSFNSLKISLIELGDKLAPTIEFLAEKISQLAEWFGGLDENTQQNIVTFGLLAAALGPILLMVGQLITTGGSLVSMFGKLSGGAAGATGATSVLTKSLGFLAGPQGIALVIGALVGLMAWLGDSESSILMLQEKFGGLGYIIGSVCEYISGIVQLTFGNLGISIMGICDVIAAMADGPGGQTVSDAWDRMNAKLTLNTEEAMMKITTTTSRGMSQMRAMSEEQLNGLVLSTDTLMQQIPVIAEGNYSQAADKIAGQLQSMDANQLLALTGMNDTTKAMFQGINASMTVEEMANQVAWNMKQMHTAGALEVTTLEKDVSSAMETLKKNVDSKTKAASNAANNNTKELSNKVNTNTQNAKNKADTNTKALANNVDANTKNAANKADVNTKNLGNKVDANTKSAGSKTDANTKNLTKNIDSNTKSASTKADKNTKDLEKVVDNNTKSAATKADKNTDKMAQEVEKNSKAMKDKATSNANQMKSNVTSATSSMASKAISDWQRVRNEYSKSINGRVNLTRTTTNVIKTQKEDTRQFNKLRTLDINQYKTRGTYYNSSSKESVSLKENAINMDLRNIEKLLEQNSKNSDININLNFDKVEVKNDDDYKKVANKVIEQVNRELEKRKVKYRKGKGEKIYA